MTHMLLLCLAALVSATLAVQHTLRYSAVAIVSDQQLDEESGTYYHSLLRVDIIGFVDGVSVTRVLQVPPTNQNDDWEWATESNKLANMVDGLGLGHEGFDDLMDGISANTSGYTITPTNDMIMRTYGCTWDDTVVSGMTPPPAVSPIDEFMFSGKIITRLDYQDGSSPQYVDEPASPGNTAAGVATQLNERPVIAKAMVDFLVNTCPEYLKQLVPKKAAYMLSTYSVNTLLTGFHTNRTGTSRTFFLCGADMYLANLDLHRNASSSLTWKKNGSPVVGILNERSSFTYNGRRSYAVVLETTDIPTSEYVNYTCSVVSMFNTQQLSLDVLIHNEGVSDRAAAEAETLRVKAEAKRVAAKVEAERVVAEAEALRVAAEALRVAAKVEAERIARVANEALIEAEARAASDAEAKEAAANNELAGIISGSVVIGLALVGIVVYIVLARRRKGTKYVEAAQKDNIQLKARV